MRYVLKNEFKRQLAFGRTPKTIEDVEGAPAMLKVKRGMLVSTGHLVARPTGALEKFKGQIIVFSKGKTPPPANEVSQQ